jgi:hypothetical protein
VLLSGKVESQFVFAEYCWLSTTIGNADVTASTFSFCVHCVNPNKEWKAQDYFPFFENVESQHAFAEQMAFHLILNVYLPIWLTLFYI